LFNIILAAGLSSRMKENKLLLKYKEMSLLEHLIKASNEANLEIIVVTGCYKKDIENEIYYIEKKYNISVHLAHNANYKYGQLSSLICGVRKLISLNNKDNYFISVGDIPLLKKEDFYILIPNLQKHDALRPYVNGKFGHPVLINNKISLEIINLDYKNKNEGLRSFLKNKDTIAFKTSNTNYINDIDTKDNYDKLISNLSSS